jgi:hypothetical protein
MAKEVLGKTVRIDDRQFNPKGAKFEVWTKGRHKYIKWYRDEKNGLISTENYIDSGKISASLTDDEVIKSWLFLRETAAKINTALKVYKVIQDPYSDDPITKRVYGDGKSPYYLNNGCSINIEWRGDKPNPDFTLGTFSNPEDAEDYYRKQTNGVRNGPDRFLKTTYETPVIITSDVDNAEDKSKLPMSSWVIAEPFVNGVDVNSQPEMSEANFRDKSNVWSKVVTVNMPTGFTENGGEGYLVWTDGGLQYNSKAIPEGTQFESFSIDRSGYGRGGRPRDQIVYFRNNNKDSDIVSSVIEKFKSMVVDRHGISRSDYDLKLCSPDSEACKLIEYKSPLEAPNNSPNQAAINDTPGLSQSVKIKLNIQGLFDSDISGSTSSVFEIKAKTDLPTFTIWTGDIPQTELIDEFDDLQELDPEYVEESFNGDEEAPPDLKDPDPLASNINDDGSSMVNDTTVYDTSINSTDGPVVTLPKGRTSYSHNATQGYNLVDSKWYGNLLTSAKQHIETPTFDIPGTESGNLGCASWVSLVFYRAFGVHMKNGKSVKAIPKSISDFGSTGTGELGGWFNANPNMWTQIPWKEGQPGDVINTERGSRAGHVGIVMDTKNKDGSWNVASNSSGGFGNSSDPLGCGKMNYSITKWQSVTNRNPNRTFCWRYKGPRLPQGQTA